MGTEVDPTIAELLGDIGERVRTARRDLDMTQRELSEIAGISVRFLAQLERGEANVSLARLVPLCGALGTSLAVLFEGLGPSVTVDRRKLSLLGMRGSGKTSVGRIIADRVGAAFVELDEEIERAAGMTLSEMFELSDRSYYRKLEREALERVLNRRGKVVIATGGSIVMEPVTYEFLRERTRTVYLRATPEAHWNRVVAQGDTRPMRDRPDAMEQLRRLLEERTPFYGQAELTVDTMERSPGDVADTVVSAIRR